MKPIVLVSCIVACLCTTFTHGRTTPRQMTLISQSIEHNYSLLLPPDQYLEEHPEYFARGGSA